MNDETKQRHRKICINIMNRLILDSLKTSDERLNLSCLVLNLACLVKDKNKECFDALRIPWYLRIFKGKIKDLCLTFYHKRVDADLLGKKIKFKRSMPFSDELISSKEGDL